MACIDESLRAVREELAPEIPRLATRLIKDHYAIRIAIDNKLIENGVDPASVPPRNMNKLERHTVSAWAIGASCELLVVGHGHRAHFHPGLLSDNARFPAEERGARLTTLLESVLDRGGREVERRFTDGQDAEHRTWPTLAFHYKLLADLAELETPGAIPDEGMRLDWAVRSKALGDIVVAHAGFIDRTVTGNVSRKLWVAHGTAYAPHAVSARHLEDAANAFYYSTWALPESCTIREIPTSDGEPLHIIDTPYEAPHAVTETTNATMMCAARAGGNLMTLMHAGINATPNAGYFRA